MRFTSIDIECAQPSGAIIQIGAVVFDTDNPRRIVDEWCNYIDPGEPVNWEHKLNVGCTLEELLAPGFRKAFESEALNHDGALASFWQWHKNIQAGKKFIQYGRGDVAQIVKESQGLGYPSHLKVLDLKQVYKFLWQPAGRLEKQSGLGAACQNMCVNPPNPAHDALNDARATGWLFCEMYRPVKGVSDLLGFE